MALSRSGSDGLRQASAGEDGASNTQPQPPPSASPTTGASGGEMDVGALTSDSPISAVLNYWREFDLESSRSKLDGQGLRIAENQENSLKNRRKLAELTRDFKKNNNEEKLKLMGAILKAYQEEVDNLTKRAKFSETAFLSVYQLLYEAPDPVPSLSAAAEAAARLLDLDQESRRMRQELQEFRAESANLKNQQVTIRRLEERNRLLEAQVEEKNREISEVRQKAADADNQKAIEAAREREEFLEQQLEEARSLTEAMQRVHDYSQSQLFQLKEQSEEEKAAKQAELDMLSLEIERSHMRAVGLERAKTDLEARLAKEAAAASATGGGGSGVGGGGGGETESWEGERAMLESELVTKDRLISQLHADISRLEEGREAERQELTRQTNELRRQLDESELLVSKLKSTLSSRPSVQQVEELRKQIKVLQAVSYNSIEEDWELSKGGAGGVPGGVGSGSGSHMERMLIEKNRKVEHELTQARVHLAEREKQLLDALAKVSEVEAKLKDKETLVEKLEEDIRNTGQQGDGRGGDDWESAEERSVAQLVGGKGRGLAGGGAAGAGGGGGAQGRAAAEEEPSMLAMVCGQRDRFRQRVLELEEQLRATATKLASTQSDLEACKQDNVALYHKLRYVQGYQQNVVGKGGSASGKKGDVEEGGRGAGGEKLVARGSAGESEVESKYRRMYEDGINPFTEFSRQERDRRKKDLRIHDRLTLQVVGNKYARAFVFFYFMALHLLVFTIVYRYAYVRSMQVHHALNARDSTTFIISSAANATTALLHSMR